MAERTRNTVMTQLHMANLNVAGRNHHLEDNAPLRALQLARREQRRARRAVRRSER